MLERYSHIRLEAKRNALEALSNKSGNGTKSGTKPDSSPLRIADFGHKNGRRARI
jgi:hypothetical protein